MSDTTKRTANPFPPILRADSRILILGSLPSEASRAAGFYYMNPRNRFWKMLSALFGEDFTAMSAEGKTSALLSRGIALSDVILSCEIHRSADASIKDAECTDIPYILHNTQVEKILLNGKKAYALFLRFFPQYAHLAISLPSTSPANAQSSFEDLLSAWRPFLTEKVRD